ncbi:MAG: pyruvate carboxylase subunit B [Thermoleophilia bacterium]|nr:pyruvate carboxylase subunit B [Thermoleophilia bacterium]
MDTVQFVDQTIRDAQQSLWGNMMRTEHILPIAETMDTVGYRAIATVGSQAFTVAVRNLGEDPWERIRLLSELMPVTPLRGSYQTASLSSFDLSTPRDIISLWIKRSVANGIRSFWICDYQENMERFRYFAQIAKAEGAEIVTSLMYTSSPLHTDEHWVAKTRLIADSKDCIDRIMISDESGIITPERTRELVSLVQRNCEGIPLEFHGHCNSGLAPLCYLAAIQAGVTTVHTAVAPLANGTSLPATETVLKNMRRLGYESDLDEDALATVSAHFRQIAEREGLPTGRPMEYDLFHFEHQVPGGMVTNFTRQLREIKMEHRLDEILEEAMRVRREYGYPVMATPYSQIVGVQAFENVVSGERYKHVTDESIKYLLGYYGEPAYPLDQDLLDRVMSLPRTKELLDWKPEGYLKSVEEIRRELGPDLTDDDLLLKVLIPGRPATPKSGPAAAAGAAGADGGGASAGAAPSGAPPAASLAAAPDLAAARYFTVEVDGEIFNVKISPTVGDGDCGAVTVGGGAGEAAPPRAARETPEGAIIAGAPGLVLSILVHEGESVAQGDEVALMEVMKMRRYIVSSRPGVVKEVWAQEGQMLEADDVLLVVG